MNALIVQPAQPLAFPVIVIDSAIALRAAELTTLAENMEVTDVFGLTAADEVKKDCANLLKAIEAERVKVKTPFLDIGKQIDSAAKGVTAKLEAANKVLMARIWEYQQEQERIRQETIAKLEQARRETEAKLQAERDRIAKEAAAKAEAARLAGQPPPKPVVMTPVRPVASPVAYVPPVQKSASVTTVKKTILVIDDLDAIPQMIGSVMLWTKTLKEDDILGLLKVKMIIPGCHMETKEVPRGM